MGIFAVADRPLTLAGRAAAVMTFIAVVTTIIAKIQALMGMTTLHGDFFRLTATCKEIFATDVSRALKITPAYKVWGLGLYSLFCMALLASVSFITASLQVTHLLSNSFSNTHPKRAGSVLIGTGFRDLSDVEADTSLMKLFESYSMADAHWKILDPLDSTTITSLALRYPGHPEFSGGCPPYGEYSAIEWLESVNSAMVLFAMASLQESFSEFWSGEARISVDNDHRKSLRSEAVGETGLESLYNEPIVSMFEVYFKSLDRKTVASVVQLLKFYSGAARSGSTTLVTHSCASDREVDMI
jgi:hypothetical protein